MTSEQYDYRDIPIMMHTIDAGGRLVDVNPEWCRVMGYAREEVLGRKSIEFLTERSRSYAVSFVLPQFFEEGTCRNVPFQFVTKDARILDIELSALVVRGADGEAFHARAVLVDVTERNRIYRQATSAPEQIEVIDFWDWQRSARAG